MKSLFVATILLSSTAFALPTAKVTTEDKNTKAENVYDLNMELFIGGALVSKPRVIVREGHTATIQQDTGDSQSVIEVVSREGEVDGNKGIQMNFDITHITEDGTNKVNAKPVILTKSGSESNMYIGEEGNYKDVRLKVTASRRNPLILE